VLLLAVTASFGAEVKPENVIIVLVDGLRWQEVFRGPDPAFTSQEKWKSVGTMYPNAEALMPFLHSVIGQKGQLYGNRDKNCLVTLANPHHFSYPGYNEQIAGFYDPRITSNEKKPNPNRTVLDFLNEKPAYKGKVTVFAAWDVVDGIQNTAHTGVTVNAGITPMKLAKSSARMELLNDLKADLHHPWGTEPYDAITFHTALEYIKLAQPKVVWITFGETDEFAHEGNYAAYCQAAHRTDKFLKTLWDYLQTALTYRGKTTLIVAPDHGRGRDADQWPNHGATVPGAEEVWVAIIGPHTPALGQRSECAITLGQVAATAAAALGEDYAKTDPKVLPPIDGAIRSGDK